MKQATNTSQEKRICIGTTDNKILRHALKYMPGGEDEVLLRNGQNK